MSNPSKQKGTAFETSILGALREGLGDNKIHRSPLHGTKDIGDFVNVETKSVDPIAVLVATPTYAAPLAVEAKNHKTIQLSAWIKEAQTEARNANATAGVVVHKRHGVADPMKQLVTCELGDFLKIIGGKSN